MSVGDIAGLIAAIVFAILAGFLIYPLIRLGKLLDQIAETVKQTGDHALPALDESVTTVREVNKTLKDVNQISDSAQYTARNAGALTDLYASILSKPAIKIASWASAVSGTFRSFAGKNKKGEKAGAAASSSSAQAERPSKGTGSAHHDAGPSMNRTSSAPHVRSAAQSGPAQSAASHGRHAAHAE